jgi:exodeoxyribonuclease V alpha subunit
MDKSMQKGSQVELEGQVERVTYTNEETGYTVVRVRLQELPDPVTAVGNLIAPAPGEIMKMRGEWQDHPRFGRQFKVSSHRVVLPATVQGIRKYLGSGLVKGIGPVMAARIVKKFGEKTLDVIEHRIEELAQIEGIGRKRIDMIGRAWDEQKEIRDVMIFLQEHGVSTAFGVKIFKKYGWDSITLLKENPYRLATDIHGIGFLKADQIAKNLGFEKSAPVRAEAGILYVLQRLADEGHVLYPYERLIEKCLEILEVDREVVLLGIGALDLEGKIVMEDLNPDMAKFEANRKAVYLSRFHTAERGIEEHLKALLRSQRGLRTIKVDKALPWVQDRLHVELAPKQVQAVKRALTEKVMVITGGPGTGKTTIIHALIQIYRGMRARVLQAAPTGRASKRMEEATGYPARTIHRMLEYSFRKGGFQRNQDNPLEVDVLIMDEGSMIDTILMYHLLKAVPPEAAVVIVGDVNQLPSVGAGSVLKDVIRSGAVPVVELTDIFRQAEKSLIIVNAHKINQGVVPREGPAQGSLEDFYFIEQEEPDSVLKVILELVCERVPKRFRLDPVEDIQVLAPMHKGVVGTENLNQHLQGALNPSPGRLVRGGRGLRLHDKVMQIRNNYEKEVFNGDMGRITAIDGEGAQVTVTYDGRPVPYDYPELDEITLAYAISVHKSQGSEYPAVIMPILTQHYILLQRNLIYTAVTRGKRLVIMVGSRKALAMGVHNDQIMRRYTNLAEMLRS